MAEKAIYKDNDNYVTFTEMRDLSQSANSFVDGTATVTMTLKTTNGTTVSGQTFPATLTYNSAKGRGTFNGTPESGLSITEWQHYHLELNVSGGGFATAKSTIKCFARIRGLF